MNSAICIVRCSKHAFLNILNVFKFFYLHILLINYPQYVWGSDIAWCSQYFRDLVWAAVDQFTVSPFTHFLPALGTTITLINISCLFTKIPTQKYFVFNLICSSLSSETV